MATSASRPAEVLSPGTARVITAIVACALIGADGLALTTIPHSNGVIHGCYASSNGSMRIVDSAADCKHNEKAIQWNVTGPQGVPGTNGTNGANGANGTNGADGKNATHAAPPCFDNTNRYVDCGNGTVTDTLSGLIWLRDVNCLGNWPYDQANQAAAALANGQCGLTDESSAGDWRLPTKAEWDVTTARALALGCTGPVLTNDAGTGCLNAGTGTSFLGLANDLRWSGSSNEIDPGFAWSVSLAFGGSASSGKSRHREVAPIRTWRSPAAG